MSNKTKGKAKTMLEMINLQWKLLKLHLDNTS